MPIAKFQMPDGRIGRFEVPEGTTPEQAQMMISEQVKQMSAPAQQPVPPSQGEPQQSWLQEVRGGLASAPIDLYLGLKQLTGDLSPVEKDVLRQNREAAKKAPVASIASNLATYAPLSMIPGANTIAGGAAIGAGTGFVQPVDEGESRLLNTIGGGVAGAAVPATLRAGKAAKAALIDPFTEAGKSRIAGGALSRAAGNKEQAMANLLRNKGATPGFSPTVGQAADDAGLAAMERAARAVDPGAFQATESGQRQAIADALRKVAGSPEARQAAAETREIAANALYGKAFASDAMRRDLVEQAAKSGAPFSGVGGAIANQDLATSGLRELAKRPMFQQAIEQAKALAANKGVQIKDPLQSLEGLHYIKLALDDMATPNAMNAMGKNANAAVNQIRTALTNELETVAPMYGAARSTFANMSQPINQMDIGQEIVNRTIPAIYRDMPAPQQLNANQFAKLINEGGDNLARNVTGMKSATLQGVMSPEQMQTLRGVASDLQLMKRGENLGRGVGSDTVQKAAMSHIAAEAGIPNWMSSVARVPGGMLRDVGNALYGSANKDVSLRLAEALRNPEMAAQLMQQHNVPPSEMAKLLRTGAQGLMFSTVPALQQ